MINEAQLKVELKWMCQDQFPFGQVQFQIIGVNVDLVLKLPVVSSESTENHQILAFYPMCPKKNQFFWVNVKCKICKHWPTLSN